MLAISGSGGIYVIGGDRLKKQVELVECASAVCVILLSYSKQQQPTRTMIHTYRYEANQKEMNYRKEKTNKRNADTKI